MYKRLPHGATVCRLWCTWLGLAGAIGAVAGVAAAAFLWALAVVTQARLAHPQIVYGLPLAGAAWGGVMVRFGVASAGGTNLVLDHVHHHTPEATTPRPAQATTTLPLALAPLVLMGTLLTHLFGGSAGREGTAVQMGAAIADVACRMCGRLVPDRSPMLMAGMAGGFGAVFGTPVAGALFAVEVVAAGGLNTSALLPCLTASFVGDWVVTALGMRVGEAMALQALPLTPVVALRWLAVGAAMGVVALAFIELTHAIARTTAATLRPPVRLFMGGMAIVASWRLLGTDAYLGLSEATLSRAFFDAGLSHAAWAYKLALTAVTVGSGFIGGEVTPLFFIGASAGNALAQPLQLPLGLTAAACMVAIFGAAANAPIAVTVMAVELFGGAVLPHVALVATVAYLCSGRRSIYRGQRLPHNKYGAQERKLFAALREL